MKKIMTFGLLVALLFSVIPAFAEPNDENNSENSITVYDWYYANSDSSQERVSQRDTISENFRQQLLNTEQKLFLEGDKISHDATLKYDEINQKLYVVNTSNTTDKGDSSGAVNAFVRFQRFGINEDGNIGESEECFTVFKHGDIIDGKTITSGSGIPNAAIKDRFLYIYSSVALDDTWYYIYNTYNLDTYELGDAHILSFDGKPFSTQQATSAIGKSDLSTLSMNGDISYHSDGYYYANICYAFYILN